jgi:hypothetical protein
VPIEGFIDVALKDAIEEGAIPGPHLFPAAHAITIPCGHGAFFPAPPFLPMDDFYTPLHGFINSPAALDAVAKPTETQSAGTKPTLTEPSQPED